MQTIELSQSVILPLSKLRTNSGQIKGLPANPRILKNEKFDKLKKSIIENPEMMSLRELLVYPMDDATFVVIGGNMRYKALKDLKYTDAPCKIIPASTPVEMLQAYTIKDNSAFGEWDFDMLANEWDVSKLDDWGLDLNFDVDTNINPDDLTDDFTLKDGDKSPFQAMTFYLANEQAETVKQAVDDIKKTDEYKTMITFGNENTNANAIYLIVQQWRELKK